MWLWSNLSLSIKSGLILIYDVRVTIDEYNSLKINRKS